MGVGYHYLQALEYATGATVTFFGDGGGALALNGLEATLIM